MNIKKRSDLFREYARVIDMCEGTGVKPHTCVKLDGRIMTGNPGLDSPVEMYTFAIAILKGRPLFNGDEVYLKDGRKYDWNAVWMGQIVHYLTWNKPKRTFKLAGRELSLPSETETQCNAYIGSAPYYFDDPADSYAFEDALNAIIREAIENERLQNK